MPPPPSPTPAPSPISTPQLTPTPRWTRACALSHFATASRFHRRADRCRSEFKFDLVHADLQKPIAPPRSCGRVVWTREIYQKLCTMTAPNPNYLELAHLPMFR